MGRRFSILFFYTEGRFWGKKRLRGVHSKSEETPINIDEISDSQEWLKFILDLEGRCSIRLSYGIQLSHGTI